MARKMKDSGIEWIGEIPEGWEVHRMKSCISQKDGGAWGDEATGETGDCICLRIADFDYEHFRFTDSNNLTIRHYASPIIKKLLLQKNDILIEKSGGGEKTPVGRTVLFDKEYPALFANFMDRLRCSDFILPQYLQYVFVTFYKNRYTQNYIKQTTGIQNLDLSSMLADEFVPVPNLNEQKRIVCYLELKCTKIDNLLTKTRSSIEEYKKLKQAVITQAVTKGVRGERKMKDSGVEWIGEIPEEWGISRIKYVSIFEPSCDFRKLTPETIITYAPMECIKNGTFERRTSLYGNLAHTLTPFQDGDIVMAKVTPCFENGNIAIMNELQSGYGLGSSELFVFRPQNINTKYLFYWLQNKLFVHQACATMTGTGGLKRISPSFVKNCNIHYPAAAEQAEIADYLDAKCAEIDGLIAKKEQLVKELESYKKSLIYEVVTGKREV